MKDPTGMLMINMLWFIPKSLAPKSSLVVDTEIVEIAPVDTLIMAVLMYREMLLFMSSMKNAPLIGAIIIAIAPALELMHFVLKFMSKFVKDLCDRKSG